MEYAQKSNIEESIIQAGHLDGWAFFDLPLTNFPYWQLAAVASK